MQEVKLANGGNLLQTEEECKPKTCCYLKNGCVIIRWTVVVAPISLCNVKCKTNWHKSCTRSHLPFVCKGSKGEHSHKTYISGQTSM